MKIKILALATCLSAAASLTTLHAQDPFVANGIDQESLIWISEARPRGTDSGDITPIAENVWHLVTDESFVDGDAITVKNPYNLKYASRLETSVGAPIQVKFRAMKSPTEVGDHLTIYATNHDSDLVFSETVELGEGWENQSFVIDHLGPVNLYWSVQNTEDLQAQFWLDNVEILNTDLPQFLEPLLPTELLIPTATPFEIHDRKVALAGAFLSYQWFKNDLPIPGETNPPIEFPAVSEPGQLQYQLEVTNELGSTNSSPIQVEYFSIAEVLESPSLVFEAGRAGNYAEMIVTDEEAYDGEDAIYLYRPCVRYCTPISRDTARSISTEIEGPAIMSFFRRGSIRLALNSESPLTENEVTIDHGEWIEHHLRLSIGRHRLHWSAESGGFAFGELHGWIDQLQVNPLTENTFGNWALSHYSMEQVFTDLETVEEADHDNNGISNLLEWALNKHLDFPYSAQVPEVMEIEGKRYLGLTFSRPADLGDYTFFLEGTEDLTNWARIISVTTETYNPSNDTYTVFMRGIQPLSDKKRILRLTVE